MVVDGTVREVVVQERRGEWRKSDVIFMIFGLY